MLACLALAGCGRDMSPAGYTPAGFFKCTSLDGTYRVTDVAEVRRIHPDLAERMGDGMGWLRIQSRQGADTEVSLRREAGDVLAEAATLRIADPARYRQWRGQLLSWLGHAPPIIGVPSGENVIAGLGPAVAATRPLGLGQCERGWWTLWPLQRNPASDASAAPRWIGTMLARGRDGELLVRSDHYEEKSSGFIFFGQGVTYNSYVRSEWRRMAPADPATVVFDIDPADLPDPKPRLAVGRRLGTTNVAFRSLRDAIAARAGEGARITILREVQFDPAALAVPPDIVRVELAGYYNPALSPDDPFTSVLRADPRVAEIDVRRHELLQDGRGYTLMQFNLQRAPE